MQRELRCQKPTPWGRLPEVALRKRRNCLNDKDNYLKTAELPTQQNANMIDGIMNNAPMVPAVPVPAPVKKSPDRVKEIPHKRRFKELER